MFWNYVEGYDLIPTLTETPASTDGDNFNVNLQPYYENFIY